MDNNSRIYHSIKNISYGVISTGINTFISFISRTMFVKILGAEYLGLNGLFTEVIAMSGWRLYIIFMNHCTIRIKKEYAS